MRQISPNSSRGRGRRARRASLSVVLTAVVILAVMGVNVLFSALAARGLWFTDMTTYIRTQTKTSQDGQKVKIKTPYEFYTLSDGCVELLGNSFAELDAKRQSEGAEPVEVELIFCEDPDNLMENEAQRMVYLTALSLQKRFPDIVRVSCINVYKNPSAVQKYKNNAYTTVYSSNVIIASGTEYRRLSYRDFFTFESTDASSPWAYSGEKRFASAILAVTKAVSPVCCLLTNHGESGYSDGLRTLLADAGYTVVDDFDLEHDEIPADCRLMISVGPREDLTGYPQIVSGQATVSEVARLDAFLDEENAFLVFFDPDTPVLPNFEEYLEKWGTQICRVTDEAGLSQNYLVRDAETSLSADGQTLIGDYVSTGLGGSMTADMRSLAYPAKVIFPNATALTYSRAFKTAFVDANEDNGTPAYSYGSYGQDGVYRQVFDVFTSGSAAQAYAGDDAVAKPSEDATYRLMTIAIETSTEPGDRNGYTTVSHNSYVMVGASTDFLDDELLQSNAYGNADMLAGVLRSLGQDSMAARIEQYIKPFRSTEIGTSAVPSATYKKNMTLTLALIPAVLAAGLCITIVTRRKYA